ncbi:hypothetical protein ACFQ1I_16565 [Kitasatospora arboriphila]
MTSEAAAPAAPIARPTRRPAVEEIRLTSFKSYRRTTLPLSPLTVLHGPSGVGKSNALDALAVLSRLAIGEEIGPSLDGVGGTAGPLAGPVRGGLMGCVPHGRNAIILGCTVRSCAGPIRLELVVRTDGRVRVAREWLTLAARPWWRPANRTSPRAGSTSPGTTTPGRATSARPSPATA